MEETEIDHTSDRKIIVVCALLLLAIFLVDSLTPLGVAGGVPYILVVLVALWGRRPTLPYYIAACGSFLTAAGFFVSPIGGELAKIIANRILALCAIWATAILSVQRKRIHEEKEEALQHVQTLRGMLPICASCKKIRDDSGYWRQIESYIAAHTEAEFSHGICPECARKIYPDIEVYEDK